jgi:hypothetical protein
MKSTAGNGKRRQPSQIPAVEARTALLACSAAFRRASADARRDTISRLLADYFTFNEGTAGIRAFTLDWAS